MLTLPRRHCQTNAATLTRLPQYSDAHASANEPVHEERHRLAGGHGLIVRHDARVGVLVVALDHPLLSAEPRKKKGHKDTADQALKIKFVSTICRI